MKIEILKTCNYAIGGIKIVSFDEGEVVSVDDKRLDRKTIERLVEIGLACEVEAGEEKVTEHQEYEQAGEQEAKGVEKEGYKDINNKDELEVYAKEKFGIELDKRRSLRNMLKDLETKLKG